MRKTPDAFATTTMLGLCLIWGLQQVAMKAVSPEVDPMMQVALRSAVAALLVLLLARFWVKQPWRRDGIAGPALIAGGLFGVQYVLISEGLHWTSAAHMSVFQYTAPVFAAIGLHLRLPAERLAPLQWLGIAIAFFGIALTFLWPSAGRGAEQAQNMLWGDLLGLMSGAAFGLTTVAVRTTALSEAPVSQTLFYQLLGGAVFGLAAAFASGRTGISLSLGVILVMSYHILIVCFASYLIWFWLLRRYLASRLGILSFLTPLIGVAAGHFLLAEPLELGFVIGALVVMAGLLIVNGADLRRSSPARSGDH